METNQVTPPQDVLDRLIENRNNPAVEMAFDAQYGEGAARQYLDSAATQVSQGEDLVIPQEHIDYLKQEPDNQARIIAFENMHGAGTAQRVLAPPVEDQGRGESFMFDTFVRAPAAGAEDAVAGVGQFGDYIGDSLFGPTGRFVWGDGGGIRWVSAEEFASLEQQGKINPEGIDYIGDAEGGVGGFVQGATSFALPYFGVAGKVVGGGKVVQGLVAGALVDGIVMNPDDPNLTSALEMMGADMGLVSDLLATDPEDPEWLNRARNVGEGAVLGLAMEAIFYGLRAAKAGRNGSSQAAEAFLKEAEVRNNALQGEINALGEAAVRDVNETLDVAARMFDEVSTDGQLSLNLETPAGMPSGRPAVTPTVTSANFRMTPQQIEQVRYYTRLAASNPEEAARSGNFSWRSIDTLNDYDDVLSEIAAIGKVMGEEISAIKGGDVQRWSTVKAQAARATRNMADMLGENPDDLLKRFNTAGMPYDQMAGELLAREKFLLNLEMEIKNLAEQISSGKVEGYKSVDEAVLAFNARREIAANLLANNNAFRSNVARTLSAMRISRTADPDLRKMITNSLSNSDAHAVARAITESNSPLKAALGIGDKLQRVMDRVNHFRINALLSGVGTQIVNVTGTALNSVAIPLQQILGGEVKHGMRTLRYQLASSLDALQMAKTSFIEDTSILDVLSTKFDFDNDIARGAKNLPDTVISLPSRMLLAMDEFFKQSTYRGRIMADALEGADNAGLKGVERDAFVERYLRESYGKNGEALRTDALLQAQRTTFTESLEAGSFGQKIQSLGRGKGMGTAAFRFVMPFVKTPINILSQSLQNMPVLQFASKRFREDLAAGGIRAAQARGKIATGFALGSVGYFLAGAGVITGSGPSDPRIRAEWIAAGNRPYSIRIENEDGTYSWIEYRRYEPLANVLSVIADLNEIMRDPYNESDNRKMPVAAAVALALAENTVNKTFTTGLSDFFDMLQGRQQATSALYNMMGSFVPNILNQTNGDEAFREIRSIQDSILSRTGLYNGVDPRRSILGDVITRPVPKWDPLGLSTLGERQQADLVAAEIARISIQDGSAFQMPRSSYRVDGKVVDLKDMDYNGGPQSMYDRYLELTSTVEIRGKTLREQLAETMASRDYQLAPDGGRGLTSSGTKGSIINSVIGAYRDAAEAEFPELQEFLQNVKINERQQMQGQYRSNLEGLRGTSDARYSSFYEAFYK